MWQEIACIKYLTKFQVVKNLQILYRRLSHAQWNILSLQLARCLSLILIWLSSHSPHNSDLRLFFFLNKLVQSIFLLCFLYFKNMNAIVVVLLLTEVESLPIRLHYVYKSQLLLFFLNIVWLWIVIKINNEGYDRPSAFIQIKHWGIVERSELVVLLY